MNLKKRRNQEEELEIEKAKNAKYKSTVLVICKMIDDEEERILNSKMKEMEAPSKKSTKVHFAKASPQNIYTTERELTFTPVCESYSVLGSCQLKSFGRCHGKHPRKICSAFRDKGNCQWS